MSKPIEGCPQPEAEIRERAYTPEQLERHAKHCDAVEEHDAARMLRTFAATLRQQQEYPECSTDEPMRAAIEAVAPLLRAPAEQGGRVDDGMLRNVLGNVIKSMRATGRSWGPTRQAQVLDTWADEIETTLEAALAQNAQEEAAVEIVEWKENASPRLRFFTKVSNLPAGTKLYTHAERARVPEGWVMVPVDPTPEMIAACVAVWQQRLRRKAEDGVLLCGGDAEKSFRENWAAMLAAIQPATHTETDLTGGIGLARFQAQFDNGDDE